MSTALLIVFVSLYLFRFITHHLLNTHAYTTLFTCLLLDRVFKVKNA